MTATAPLDFAAQAARAGLTPPFPAPRLIDDDERTWETRAAYPVLLDSRGLVIGPYGHSHSEALELARGAAFDFDGGAVAGQLAPNGELLALPEGDTGPDAQRLLAALVTALGNLGQ
jgi:hypothetical protein